jgi:hypothetical protein
MVQNSDILVRLTLTDSDGVAIDPTTINDYEFYVYRQVGNDKVLLATYKKSNTGLYGIAYDPVGDVYDIIINRELTSIIPNGKIYIEVLMQLVDATYKDGFKNVSSTHNLITTIAGSAAPESLL